MEKLLSLLEKGVTASHTIQHVKDDLLHHQYNELDLSEKWDISEDGKYYVNLYGTNCLAFRVGSILTKAPQFRIALAHSDYPCFQIKPNPTMKGKFVTKLNVEIYGGMYQKSWLDRPLGIAGKVIVEGEDVFSPRVLLYQSKQPLCMIPSLAIHMDRELNKKGALDTAKELVPILALSEDADLIGAIAKELKVSKDCILDYDLYLYNMDKPQIMGLDSSMLSSPRLDNLTSVSALSEGLQDANQVPNNTIDMMVVFDNEEVGSLSKQGADSRLLSMIIEKIGNSLFQEDFKIADVLTKSFLLSVDVAHANHPNYEEKSDATNKAYLGKGVSIKRSVGQKYATTSESAAIIKNICNKREIPYTIAVNKTGIAGGCTLGPIANAYLPFPSADIGMPILAMHSATEFGAVQDYLSLKALMEAFYTI